MKRRLAVLAVLTCLAAFAVPTKGLGYDMYPYPPPGLGWGWHNINWPALNSWFTYSFAPDAGPSRYRVYYPGGMGDSYTIEPTGRLLEELQQQAKRTSLITVILPTPDASLWMDNIFMTKYGTTRQYITPVLDIGRHYTYDIRAVWYHAGKRIEQVRKVPVRAGSRETVDFTVDEPAPEPKPFEPDR